MKKMKFSIRLFAIIIGLLLFIQIPIFAATGKSTAANVRVRKSASTEAEVIDLLAVDDIVEILSQEGDWYKVSFKGNTGYVSQSFISTKEKLEENNPEENNNQNTDNNENSETSNAQNNENNNQSSEENENQDNNTDVTVNQTSNTTNKIYKMAENTNLNILPVVTSEYIGEVKKDDEVTLISNAGLWVYIKVDNICGWIRIDKLSTENVTVENDGNDNQNDEKIEDNENTNNDENSENSENIDNEQNTGNQDNKKQENTNTEAETNFTPKTMYSRVTATNVRSQANTTSDVVDSIGINKEVKVIAEENGWYKVEVNGKTGYIRKDLLSDAKTEVSSRSNDIDRTTASNQGNSTQTTTEANTAPTTSNNIEADVNVETGASTTATETQTNTSTSSTGVTGNDIVAYAKQFLGCRYVYGAAGPSSFDCSGLTMYVYKHFGYSLSHSSKVQATQGRAVTGELQPGDILVFSNDGKTIGHVGIYIGNDQFIHASDSTTGVIISRLSDSWNKSKYRGARRIL